MSDRPNETGGTEWREKVTERLRQAELSEMDRLRRAYMREVQYMQSRLTWHWVAGTIFGAILGMLSGIAIATLLSTR